VGRRAARRHSVSVVSLWANRSVRSTTAGRHIHLSCHDSRLPRPGDVVPLITTDVAVLNHPTIGPRLRAQNHQLQSFLTGPDTSTSARLHAEAALGAIWRPLITEPLLDLANAAHQHTFIDAAVATLQPSRPTPTRNPYRLSTPAGTPSTSSERCRPNIAGR
jgi:hypothetical protein